MSAVLAIAPGDHRSAIERHRADALTIDERVQRSVNHIRVRKIAGDLNLDGLGTITVSRRPNGSMVIIDGQHRVLALLESGLGDTVLSCEVFDGLDTRGEAVLFLVRNASQKPNPVDSYRLGLLAGDEECLAVQKIVDSAGLRVALQCGPGVIACVTTMRTLYRKAGANALAPALRVPLAAWGTEATSVEAPIVAGIGAVFARYDGEIDRAALIRKLSKFPGGATGLLGKAKGLHEMRKSVSIGRCVAILVVDLYNRGRRGDPLATF